MHAFPRRQHLTCVCAGAVGHIQGIVAARRFPEIDQTRIVRRPGRRVGLLAEKRARRASGEWHEQQRATVARIEPDLRAVAGKTQLSYDHPTRWQRREIARQVRKVTGADLTYP